MDNFLQSFQYYEEQDQAYLKEAQTLTTQMDMNLNAADRFRLWDSALNAEWNILMKVLPKEQKEKLREEEREWIAQKEAAVKAAGAGGGSIRPLLEADTGAELTKDRVYELKAILEQKGYVFETE